MFFLSWITDVRMIGMTTAYTMMKSLTPPERVSAGMRSH